MQLDDPLGPVGSPERTEKSPRSTSPRNASKEHPKQQVDLYIKFGWNLGYTGPVEEGDEGSEPEMDDRYDAGDLAESQERIVRLLKLLH